MSNFSPNHHVFKLWSWRQNKDLVLENICSESAISGDFYGVFSVIINISGNYVDS
jgi:hypothetical protein